MTQYNGWHFFNPVKVHYGRGKLSEIASLCGEAQRLLLVTSPGFLKRGVVDRVQALLKGKKVEVLSDVEENPSLKYIEKVYPLAEGKDRIIGLGGGSVMDTAKCLSVRYADFSQMRDQIVDKKEISYRRIPFISIPTTSGTGSEVTPWATVWDKELKRKHSLALKDLWSCDALVDPELTRTMPRDLTVATGLDVLSHALETFWNRNHNPVSSTLAAQAVKLCLEALVPLTRDKDNMDLRDSMARASLLAGLAFSNTQTALAHSISYFLTMHHNIPHGIACGFSLPRLVRASETKPEIRKEFETYGGDITALREKMEDVYKALGISTRIEDYTDSVDKIRESLALSDRLANSLLTFEDIVWET